MDVEYEEDEFVSENQLNSLRGEHEPNEHWEIRREFLIAHRERLPRRKLLCLSQTYCNIETLGCRYPAETMELVAELAKDIGQAHKERQQGQIQRHMVDASAAAEQKISGSVGERSPWSPSTWVHWFWSLLNVVAMFFRSLVNPNMNSRGSQYTTDYRAPGGGPPKPPRRRMGGFADMSSLPCPPGGGG